MSNVIQHKRNSTAGLVPSTGSLNQGELAINIGDGKFYTKNSSNSVINLGVTSISGTLITPASGNFLNSLSVNGTGVSLSGHSHSVSDITNFNSSVSGLIVVKGLVPGSNITLDNNNGIYTISSAGGGGGGGVSAVTRGSFLLTASSGTFNVPGGYTVGSLDVFLNGVKLSASGDYTASNGTSFSLTSSAPSGSVIEYLSLVPGSNIANATGSGILVFNTSPNFSGIPTVPTANSGTNTTQAASTAFVRTEIGNLSIIPGSGLVGTSDLDLSTNRTLDVGAGDGISVSANAVAVDSTVVRTTGNQTIGGVKTFNDQVNVDNLRLDGNTLSSTSGDIIINPIGTGEFNVGIGTSTPSHKLQVNGNENVFAVVGSDLIAGGQPPTINLKGYTWFGKADGSVGIGAHDSDTVTFGDANPDPFFVFAGWNENVTVYRSICLTAGYDPQLFLDTNLNVGIGTATPSEKLDVAGHININNGSIKHTFDALDFENNIAPIKWYNTYNDAGIIAQIDVSSDSSASEGMLVFHTNDGFSGIQERLRITDIGNVGIGTSTPSEALDVVGNIKIAGDINCNSINIVSATGVTVSSSGLNDIWSTVVPTNSARSFMVKLSAYNTTNTAAAGWHIRGLVKRSTGNPSIVGTNTVDKWNDATFNSSTANVITSGTSLVIQVSGFPASSTSVRTDISYT